MSLDRCLISYPVADFSLEFSDSTNPLPGSCPSVMTGISALII